MERKDICSVGDVLRQVIEEAELGGKLDELKACDLWPQIIGPDIAAMTLKPYVRNGAMSIRVPDAPLRQELHMHRSAIIKEFNRLLGRQVISSLHFSS